MKLLANLSSLAITTLFCSTLQAELALPTVFSDHMVLQQGKAVPVWGWGAEPNQKVLVTFGKQKVEVNANEEGAWGVFLDPLKASSKPAILAAKAGGERIAFKDVLVGEVWIASGQSNMYWPTRAADNPEEEIEAANYPDIRLFKANLTTSSAPANDVTSEDDGWVQCEPASAAAFSAVGYYYARALHKKLKVPVGIIQSAWNSTRVEAWTSRDTLIDVPEAQPLLVDWKIEELGWTKESAAIEYKDKLKEWEETSANISKQNESLEEGKTPAKLPKKPSLETDPRTNRHHPSALFNAMIYPLIPYAVQGAIWYQGESNHPRAVQYESLFSAMITDWRIQWDDDFSFYFAQLANYKPASKEPGTASEWAELQWSQYLTQKNLKGTGMAVINDIGMANNVHPTNKQDVAERLALLAFTNDYGMKEVVSGGPLYKSHKKENGKIRISFENAKGLKAKGGNNLERFEIAGSNKEWVWADAEIDGETVIVSSAKVKKPVAVRYAWASNPEGANLMNEADLPASLFRTDTWELKTAGRLSPFQPTKEEEKEESKQAAKPSKPEKTANTPSKKKRKEGGRKKNSKEEDTKPKDKKSEPKSPEKKKAA